MILIYLILLSIILDKIRQGKPYHIKPLRHESKHSLQGREGTTEPTLLAHSSHPPETPESHREEKSSNLRRSCWWGYCTPECLRIIFISHYPLQKKEFIVCPRPARR